MVLFVSCIVEYEYFLYLWILITDNGFLCLQLYNIDYICVSLFNKLQDAQAEKLTSLGKGSKTPGDDEMTDSSSQTPPLPSAQSIGKTLLDHMTVQKVQTLPPSRTRHLL